MINFAIAPASLHHLRRRLLAAGPGLAAEVMQDAGIATGEALSAAWAARVKQRTGLTDPARLDASWFGEIFSELCREVGWGLITVDRVADRALLFSSRDWREAESGESAHPGCYFTCGCLAAFLTAQAGAALAVLEVECRSSGAEQCRFLAGSTATLGTIYDLIAAGGLWREAFQPGELPA